MKFAKRAALLAALAAGAVWAVGRRKARSDQAWFYAPEWQAGEREADEELARGESTVFENPEDMFRALEA